MRERGGVNPEDSRTKNNEETPTQKQRGKRGIKHSTGRGGIEGKGWN